MRARAGKKKAVMFVCNPEGSLTFLPFLICRDSSPSTGTTPPHGSQHTIIHNDLAGVVVRSQHHSEGVYKMESKWCSSLLFVFLEYWGYNPHYPLRSIQVRIACRLSTLQSAMRK